MQAPLTGKVIEVAVNAGDEVGADQLLVVLEAMKMEYRLTAPAAGAVQSVHCAVVPSVAKFGKASGAPSASLPSSERTVVAAM